MNSDDTTVEYSPVTPLPTDYAPQPNLLARSSYNLSTVARQVILVAWARVKIEDVKEMSVEIGATDLLHALGKTDGKENYLAIHKACREAMGAYFEIPHGQKGGYTLYHWVRRISYDPERKIVSLSFDGDQKPFIESFQNHIGYHKISVSEFAKLTGRYAQRWYERAMSWRSEAGKKGNPALSWFFEVKIPDDLRKWLMVSPRDYKRTSDLRRYTIDNPIKEINEKIDGLHLRAEYKYHGRRLEAVKIHCRMKARGEGRTVTPATQTEVELATLIEKHPDQWQQFLSESAEWVDTQPELFAESTPPREDRVNAEAERRLREWVKTPKKKGARK